MMSTALTHRRSGNVARELRKNVTALVKVGGDGAERADTAGDGEILSMVRDAEGAAKLLQSTCSLVDALAEAGVGPGVTARKASPRGAHDRGKLADG